MTIGRIMGDLRDLREENRELLPLLMEHLHQPRARKPPGPKDWLSASKAPTWCPRYHVMCYRMQVDMFEDITPQARWRMDRGSAMHIIFQELWVGPARLVKGAWKCSECGFVHGLNDDGKATPGSAVFLPEACERCHEKPGKWKVFRFIEPRVRDHDVLVKGQTDGVLSRPGFKDDILDLKSIGAKAMRYVRDSPRAGDVKQLHWYMGIAGFRSGRLIYMAPSADRIEEAICEHHVDFDPNIFLKEREKIRDLRQALEEGSRSLPPCPHGRKLPWGECPCLATEAAWRRHGSRSSGS